MLRSITGRLARPRVHCSFVLELVICCVFAPEFMSNALTNPSASPFLRNKDFEQECVSLFGEFAQSLGVPRSAGQIYGLLFASPQPLSFSDIVERLEISKGSASQGLQLLRTLGAINEANCPLPMPSGRVPATCGRKTAPGSPLLTSDVARRDYYEPELSLRRLVGGVLRERIAPFAATGAERLNRLSELAARGAGKNGFYLDRTKQLNTWRRRLNSALPVLAALLGAKSRK